MPVRHPEILARQQRGVPVGVIRIGDRGGNNGAPQKLDQFFLTSPSEAAIRSAAEVLGGEAAAWHNQGSGAEEWGVYTGKREIDVVVPPGGVDSWFEMWGKGSNRKVRMLRRCSGDPETSVEQRSGKLCRDLCPHDLYDRLDGSKPAGRGQDPTACGLRTRINVVLPDVRQLGTWLLSTGGVDAAGEMPGQADLLGHLTARGTWLPAKLTLERVPNEHGFAWVPRLRVEESTRAVHAIAGSTAGTLAAALGPAASTDRIAITAGPTAKPAAPDDPAARAQAAADWVGKNDDLGKHNQFAARVRQQGLLDQEVTRPDTGQRVSLVTWLDLRHDQIDGSAVADAEIVDAEIMDPDEPAWSNQ